MSEHMLEVHDLIINIHSFDGVVHAVQGASMYLDPKETLAIVGESGCGKSMLMKGIMQLLPEKGQIEGGSVFLDGEEIDRFSDRQMQKIRGEKLSMIFQDPMTSLNPTMKIEPQIAEMVKKHHASISKEQLHEHIVNLLNEVGISDAEKRCKQYPFELSGGQRQRVMIAMAISCGSKILIADEPTTALDVTVQAQILDLMREVQQKFGSSIILITHNLGVVANIADRISVMYGGRFMETGLSRDIFYHACHPYTQALLAAVPKMNGKNERLQSIPGTPPDLKDPPSGCPFYARCPYSMEVCRDYLPGYFSLNEHHHAACWMLDSRAAKCAREAGYERR